MGETFLLALITSRITNNRWGIASILIGTLLGFLSAVICVYGNLVIFGFNIMFIISPLIAGFTESYIARKKHGKSTGAISALLIFIIINIYGWFFPKNPITLNLFTLGGIALTIQAAVPILVNYLLFVVFIGTITYVMGLIGNLISKVLGKEIVDDENKTVDLPKMELLFSTVPSIEGKKIVKQFGLITADTVLKEDKGEKKSSILEKIAPKNGNNMIYNLGNVRNEALKNLEEKAKEIGANAVLGITMNYENVGGLTGSTIVVTVTGNAISYE